MTFRRLLGTAVWLAMALATAYVGLTPAVLVAAPSAEQRTKLREADAAVKKAAGLYKTKKFKEAGQAVKDATDAMTELASAGEMPKELAGSLATLRKQLAKTHADLELEGIKLPPLPAEPTKESPDAASPDKPDPKKTDKPDLKKPGKPDPKKPDAKNPEKSDGKVSFTKQVAPVLLGKCGTCHVEGMKGGLSMASFASFSKGSKDGVVFNAGKSKGSRMIDMIQSGDMPRGGGKVEDAELALLIKWIDEGAKFDGKNQGAPLASYAKPVEGATPLKQLAVMQATGKEEVQFSRDIAPVLVENCIGCHGTQNPGGQFSMNTFATFLKGGASGAPIEPGKPAESLIVKKLQGNAGKRMPLNKPPLDDAVIAKFEKWIAKGGRFDALDAAQTLEEDVAIVRALAASHEELSSQRAVLANKNWRLILPDVAPHFIETTNFLVYGSGDEDRLEQIGKLAEDQAVKLQKFFHLPADQPLVKGRVTIYVFDKRYDYGEVGEMIEHREIPSVWRGHWRFTIVDAYACIMPPANRNEYSLSTLLGQEIAGVYVASLGKSPRWFTEGSARAVASKLDAKDPRVRRWDERIGEVIGGSEKADSFLTGGLPPEDADIASYAFVKWLMGNSARYQATLATLRGGTSFDQAFVKSFGGTPGQAATAWTGKSRGKW